MEVLNLTLHRKWFDMIASGEKKEEYRDIKPLTKRGTYDRIPNHLQRGQLIQDGCNRKNALKMAN